MTAGTRMAEMHTLQNQFKREWARWTRKFQHCQRHLTLLPCIKDASLDPEMSMR